MTPNTGLSGKTALVTGGGGVVGSAIARSFDALGIHTILLDHDAEGLEEVAAELANLDAIYEVELTDRKALEARLPDIARHDISILVNNAGLPATAGLETTTLDQWHDQLAVNLEAPFLLCRALVPHMRDGGWGRVINISSMAAKTGDALSGLAYSVAKAGLVTLTFGLAREFGAHGVTCNAIAPGYVDTPAMRYGYGRDELARQIEAIPVHRLATAEEIAHACAFLASPLAGSINGEVLDINGGLVTD